MIESLKYTFGHKDCCKTVRKSFEGKDGGDLANLDETGLGLFINECLLLAFLPTSE